MELVAVVGAGPPLHGAPDRGADITTRRKSHLRVRSATLVKD